MLHFNLRPKLTVNSLQTLRAALIPMSGLNFGNPKIRYGSTFVIFSFAIFLNTDLTRMFQVTCVWTAYAGQHIKVWPANRQMASMISHTYQPTYRSDTKMKQIQLIKFNICYHFIPVRSSTVVEHKNNKEINALSVFSSISVQWYNIKKKNALSVFFPCLGLLNIFYFNALKRNATLLSVHTCTFSVSQRRNKQNSITKT